MKYFIFLLILFFSCEGRKQKVVEKKDATEAEVNRSYDKNGKLINEVALKDGKRNGVSKSYYTNGKTKLEIVYQNDRREGIAKRYYENGKLYSETEYVNDFMNGIQKKYGEAGELISEGTFLRGEPCKGLKEFNDNGSVKSSFPTIVITPVNKIAEEGEYILRLSLSDKSKRVTFYEGKLTPSGCLNPDCRGIVTEKGIAEISYLIPPGSSIKKDVIIIAEIKTYLGNSLIVTRSYHLAVNN